MVDNRDKIVEFVKREGPTLPAHISKEFKLGILFSGAILSELVSKKVVKVSNTKKGGSPFYYTEGQESKLQEISQFLSGKLKEAYELIKEKKVIRDSSAEPWQRVALREIKDFATPITVSKGENSELYWKWYLSNDEDIKKILDLPKNEEPEEDIKESIKQKYLGDVKEEHKKEKPKEQQKKLEEEKEEIEKPKIIKEKSDMFLDALSFFEKNEMYVISKEVVRKNREFNFVVDIPSHLGKLRYFVKFKNKKNISEKDLIDSYKESSQKKYPVLFLSNGNLNKKAEKHLNENFSGSLVFRNI